MPKPKITVKTKTRAKAKPGVKGKAKVGTSATKTKVKTRRKSKTTTTGSKSLKAEERRLQKEDGAYLMSERLHPITERTYNLETKRKGSKAGYKKSGGKFYKIRTTVK